MRLYFPVLLMALSLIIGCRPSGRYISVCRIENNTGELIHIETNLVSSSPQFESTPSFDLNNHSSIDSWCSDFNPDGPVSFKEVFSNYTEGYLSVYTFGESGDLLLKKTWRYSERTEPGKQFFNEKALTSSGPVLLASGDLRYDYLFIIEMDDIQ